MSFFALLFVALLAGPISVMSYAIDSVGCHVVGKGKVRCISGIPYERSGDDWQEYHSMTIYTVKGDGSWIRKTFIEIYHDGYRKPNVLVEVQKIDAINKFPCFVSSNIRDGLYKVVDGQCLDEASMFIGFIKDGRDFLDEDTSGTDIFSDIGKNQDVSVLVCDSSNGIWTFKYNPITGLQTSRKGYGKVKNSTCCEDFLATDALYWKP